MVTCSPLSSPIVVCFQLSEPNGWEAKRLRDFRPRWLRRKTSRKRRKRADPAAANQSANGSKLMFELLFTREQVGTTTEPFLAEKEMGSKCFPCFLACFDCHDLLIHTNVYTGKCCIDSWIIMECEATFMYSGNNRNSLKMKSNDNDNNICCENETIMVIIKILVIIIFKKEHVVQTRDWENEPKEVDSTDRTSIHEKMHQSTNEREGGGLEG